RNSVRLAPPSWLRAGDRYDDSWYAETCQVRFIYRVGLCTPLVGPTPLQSLLPSFGSWELKRPSRRPAGLPGASSRTEKQATPIHNCWLDKTVSKASPSRQEALLTTHGRNHKGPWVSLVCCKQPSTGQSHAVLTLETTVARRFGQFLSLGVPAEAQREHVDVAAAYVLQQRDLSIPIPRGLISLLTDGRPVQRTHRVTIITFPIQNSLRPHG
ncbi:hypothetical protein JAAARDRAFT_69443, partial [Jaapia argillacea MUCL 33604]